MTAMQRVLMVSQTKPMKVYFVEAANPQDAKERFKRGEAQLMAIDIDHLLGFEPIEGMRKTQIGEAVHDNVTNISKGKRKKNRQKARRGK